jgi:hypothetical protein
VILYELQWHVVLQVVWPFVLALANSFEREDAIVLGQKDLTAQLY